MQDEAITYLRMSAELKQGDLLFIEVKASRVTRQIWVVENGIYWASETDQKDHDWPLTLYPEFNEEGHRFVMEELDGVRLTAKEFEQVWSQAQSS